MLSDNLAHIGVDPYNAGKLVIQSIRDNNRYLAEMMKENSIIGINNSSYLNVFRKFKHKRESLNTINKWKIF